MPDEVVYQDSFSAEVRLGIDQDKPQRPGPLRGSLFQSLKCRQFQCQTRFGFEQRSARLTSSHFGGGKKCRLWSDQKAALDLREGFADGSDGVRNVVGVVVVAEHKHHTHIGDLGAQLL